MLYSKTIFLFTLLILIGSANASNFFSTTEQYDPLAEQCRQLALKLEHLTHHQNRYVCRANLEGLDVYFASHYIRTHQIGRAKEVLEAAIIRVKFAFDIGCDDQDDIQDVVQGLRDVRNGL